MTSERDHLAITTIRMLALDAVEKAVSGHPGLPLGAAPLAYTVFARRLRFDPQAPHWPARDRFVLSAGHGSALLYALLHVFGYDLSIEEIKRFRQLGSLTPGHPEYAHTAGVETTTGPLGQGFATGVGMALASRLWEARLGDLAAFRVYALVSDGDLMEGISHEAASLAGHLRLGNLIYLYDQNHISIEGSTDDAFTEDVRARFSAYGWQVLDIEDVEDVEGIDQALAEAEVDARPSLLVAHTHIGYLSPVQDSAKAHGAAMGADAQRATKRAYGWPEDAFFRVPDAVMELGRERAHAGAQAREAWETALEARRLTAPDAVEGYLRAGRGDLPDGLFDHLPAFRPEDGPMATRTASGKALNALAPYLPELIGGSADLAPSNDTWLNGEMAVAPGAYAGRNIHFGVREHAMGAALSGLALSGFRAFGGTFLVFSDYMRPSVRLAALMGLPVVYVFTHDSIALGEDGPTHQPVEQTMSLRLIPNLVVIRPADAAETAQAWQVALKRREGPTAIILTRQKLPILDRSTLAPAQVADGAYVLCDAEDPDIILAAAGSEVSLALSAAARLDERGLRARVVSVPSFELLERRGEGARTALFPAHIPSLSIEAGVGAGWEFTGHRFALEHFGASGPGGEVYAALGFTPEAVADRSEAIVRGRS